MIVALLCFTALDTSSKLAASTTPVVMALWMRYLIQTLGTLVATWPKRRTLFETRRLDLQIWRVVLAVSCGGIGFLGLRYMPVGEYTAIGTLTPMVLTIAAAWQFKEMVSKHTWACLACGLIGTLFVLRPGLGVFRTEALLPLLLVVVNAGYQLLTSRIAKFDRPSTIHFYSGAGGLLLMTVLLPFCWQPLPSQAWIFLCLAGASGAAGHFLMVVAFSRQSVASLAPYLYLQISFAAAAGWLVFGHLPDFWALAGMAIIGASGAFASMARIKSGRS